MLKEYIAEIKIKNQNFLTHIINVLEYVVGSKLNKKILYLLITRNLSDEINEDLIYIINMLKNNYKKLINIL